MRDEGSVAFVEVLGQVPPRGVSRPSWLVRSYRVQSSAAKSRLPSSSSPFPRADGHVLFVDGRGDPGKVS